jgi:hypothetical protein
MNRAIRDIYFIMFKPDEATMIKELAAKTKSVWALRELYTWHGVGNLQNILEIEQAEMRFTNIILTYGDKNGIKQRFIESRSQTAI